MAVDITLTSIIYNPWSGEGSEALSNNTLVVDYSPLGFVASTSDSYKSTAGDIFKVYIDGIRIYRRSDSSYASGKNFLEVNDVDDATLNGVSTTWTNGTTDAVWTVDTANQKVIIDKTAIAAANLYKSGATNEVTFTGGTTIIEVRREVQDQSSPAVDFSNASILTEQDLDNSSANVFHMAQQAVETAGNSLVYDTGTSSYVAYQPGTTTKRKITQVADGVNANDATNVGQFNTHDAAIEAQKVATLAYQEDTEDYKLETADWATKVNGVVNTYTDNVAQNDGNEYSAKAYSVGGTGVTGGSNRGSAKDWAVGAGGIMASKPDGSEYSAKEYAQGVTATGGTAKGWASTAHGTAVPGAGANDRSALHYSTDASNSATAAANSAAAVSQVYDNFSDLYLGAMRTDKTSADAVTITGASWSKDSSSIAFTGISSGTVTIGQELTSTGTGYPVGANIIGSQTTTPLVISNPFTAAGSGATLVFQGSGVYGAYSSGVGGPSLNNDGDALVNGNLYFNSQENEMRIWQGAEWIAATAVGQTSLLEYKFVTTSGQVSSKTYSGTADVGGTLSYTQGNIIVFMNGVQLKDTTDYTATNSSSVVLVNAPALNDEINIIAFKSFTTADMVSKSNGGTFNGAVTFGAGLVANTVDINAGTVDGATIGASSHSTGKFTTCDATTDFTVGGTVITDNTITDDGTLVIASTTATSFSDGNITNVGSIALDSIVADGTSITLSSDTALATGKDIETSTTGKIKQKGQFMENSFHQSWVLGG
jgi:hypothetical protein